MERMSSTDEDIPVQWRHGLIRKRANPMPRTGRGCISFMRVEPELPTCSAQMLIAPLPQVVVDRCSPELKAFLNELCRRLYFAHGANVLWLWILGVVAVNHVCRPINPAEHARIVAFTHAKLTGLT
jgi:hypothetical protein